MQWCIFLGVSCWEHLTCPTSRGSFRPSHRLSRHGTSTIRHPEVCHMPNFCQCEICAQVTIRQANVPKKKEKQVPSRPGYRLFIDISSFKHESMGGKRHWLIVVDKFSDCSHSFFLKRKCDQIEMIPIWIKELKAKYGIDIKYIRLDNSGENRSLQTECDKQNLGKIFSFTAPGTPSKTQLLKE